MFVVVGLAFIAEPHANIAVKLVGALVIAVFGPLPLYAGVRLLRAGAVYVVGVDGIRFPMYGWPTLPWSDVQGTRIVTRRGRRYLAVDVQNVDARLRYMKSGARVARQNVRSGLGLVSIPEQLAPTSLEELQRQIEHRRAGTAAAWAAPANTGVTVLPGSSAPAPTPGRSAPLGSARALRTVAVANAALLLLAVLRHQGASTHRGLLAAIAVALFVGAFAVQRQAVLAGCLTIVAAAIVLMAVDLTAGAHVAVATRVVDLFFPICVLSVALNAWPRHARSR